MSTHPRLSPTRSCHHRGPAPARTSAWLFVLCLGLAGHLVPPVEGQQPAAGAGSFSTAVTQLVEQTRESHELPALGALVFDSDAQVLAIAVDGVLRAGDSTPVLEDSQWHIGSNTKAMTAALAAVLAEKGEVDFDAPVSDSLASMQGRMDETAAGITLAHLLNHTAGLPANPPFEVKRRVVGLGNDLAGQRLEIARWALAQEPEHEPGAEFSYSNVGYIIAGAILEQAAGKPWEDLIREHLFEPLGIDEAGFGPPQGRQPEGHRPTTDDEREQGLGALKAAGQQSDNPPFYGPAGTVHISLRDWMKFGSDQLREGRGKVGPDALLTPDSYRRLHSPTGGAPDYAFGWGLYRGPAATLPALVHDGSNTEWYARIMLNRQAKIGILIVTNAASDDAKAAIDEVGRGISEALLKRARQ